MTTLYDNPHFPESELRVNDIAFEVGAYHGAWINRIASTGAIIYGFEPSRRSFWRAMRLVGRYRYVMMFNFGLGSQNATLPLSVDDTDGASFVSGEGATQAEMVDIAVFMNIHAEIERIRLMRVNIEGGEYELVSYMIDTGIIHVIDYLMIQWHDNPEGVMAMRASIESRLEETHKATEHVSNAAWGIWKHNES